MFFSFSREVEVEIDGKSAGLVDNKLEAGASEPEENLRVLLGGFKGLLKSLFQEKHRFELNYLADVVERT